MVEDREDTDRIVADGVENAEWEAVQVGSPDAPINLSVESRVLPNGLDGGVHFRTQGVTEAGLALVVSTAGLS